MLSQDISTMRAEIRLLETIRIDPSGACLLDLHEARMRRSLTDLCGECPLLSRLERDGIRELLRPYLEPNDQGVCKLRMVYTPERVESISLKPYERRAFDRIKLVPLPRGRDYAYKLADRSWLDASAEHGVLPIFVRGDRLADTHFSNILIREDGEWLTPREPLLKGVMREHLLKQGLIREADLRTSHIREGAIIGVINAMIPLEESPRMEVIYANRDTLDVFISLK